MTKFLFLILTFLLAFASSASAQQVILTTDSTLYSVSQESIPPNDSGGRWVETNIVLTSYSGLPVRVYNFPHTLSFSGVTQGFRYDDSAFFRADSISPDYNPNGSIEYDKPWERLDSLKLSAWGNWSMSFLLPPHGTVRVPFWTKLIGWNSQPDMSSASMVLDPFSDSVVGSITYRRYWNTVFWVKELTPCAAPFLIHFDNLPLNNSGNPVVLGQNLPWNYTRDISNAHDTILDQAMATYQIVGEYSDQFGPPQNNTYNYTVPLGFRFNGAPKSVVYDTLISTLTDCWGTLISRTPIEAYSIVDMRDCYTLSGGSNELIAPFLGSVTDTIFVANTSIFPIELTNVTLTNYKTQRDFQVISVPSVIAAGNSGMIVIEMSDHDKIQDANDPRYSATLTGMVFPYQQDVSIRDSTFSIDLSGTINVYCPYTSHYIYSVPWIKHGVHPAGILFYSNDISTSYSTGKSFLTAYGNNDSVSDYFYVPYYDDPHFQLSIRNFDGFGSATLPAMLPPDTVLLLPSTNTVEVLTVFTGDDQHNYLTKLHWPRANDTVTMDVLALGASAPPFDGVTMKMRSSGFSMWPNPASSTLHISSAEPNATVTIYDLLGRVLLAAELLPNTSLDVSTFPPGIYSVVLKSKDGATSVERFSIAR
jgi:hypothetical protein